MNPFRDDVDAAFEAPAPSLWVRYRVSHYAGRILLGVLLLVLMPILVPGLMLYLLGTAVVEDLG